MTQSWEGRKAVKAAFLQRITAAQSCLKLPYSLCNFTQGNIHAAHNRVTVNSRNLVDVLALCKMWMVFVGCSLFMCKAASLFKPRHLLHEILSLCLFPETCKRNGNKFFTGQTYKENCNLWYVSPPGSQSSPLLTSKL